MRGRLWLSVVMLVGGASLFVAAGLAGPAQKKGGTLRIARGSVGSVDPALAYWSPSTFWLEFATCARLYNYPDKPAPEGAIVIPEVAKGFPKVSRDGRTQTIELKRSYRFHTGQRVRAALTRPSAVDQTRTFHDNSVLRGQEPRIGAAVPN